LPPASRVRGRRSRLAWPLASASNPKRVLLVDADLTLRELSSHVVGSNGDGLLDVAEQRVDLDGALIAEPHTGLMVLQAGHPPASGDRPVDPDLVVKILDRARGTYSVIVDGPSDRFDPLAPALAAASDATVLVVTADLTRARDLADFQRSADLAGGKLRGVVFVSRPDANA
jgi:polysaccharide biosynthesis transport protein